LEAFEFNIENIKGVYTCKDASLEVSGSLGNFKISDLQLFPEIVKQSALFSQPKKRDLICSFKNSPNCELIDFSYQMLSYGIS